MPFVTRKKSSPARMTCQSAARPTSAIRGTNELSISATPPPKGVELTWTTRAPFRGSGQLQNLFDLRRRR